MMRALWILPVLGISLFAAGCCNTCNRQTPCVGAPPPPKTVYVAPGAPMVAQPPPTFGPPAGAFPTTPPAAFGPPAGAPTTAPPPGARILAPGQQPPSIAPMPGAGSSSNRIEPGYLAPGDSPGTKWAEGREPAPNKPSIQLYAPEQIDKDKAEPTKEPPLAKKPSVQASFPAIPQFAVARDNAFAGLRPPLDGLDWLQQNGVQTVVNIRLGSTDDAADRMQVEKRKMQYVSFVVSPQTLTKEKADEFIKLIRDGARQGIFVYDEDGSLAESFWYLNFRWGEFLDDDASQLRAGQLGLRPAAGQHRDMWLAVQKLLSENNR